ncbi:MAG: Methyltransferase type 11 [Candidatus Tokpelaia sp. JSC161]|nr:MAG: Methyltransferase type 11 [Candidatus Tokpelaia sp. JSC161]
MHSEIFDSVLIENFRLRAVKKEKSNIDFLLMHACDDLAERLATVKRSFRYAIDLHSHTGLSAKVMKQSGKVMAIHRIESLSELLKKEYPSQIQPRETPFLEPNRADLIVSLLSLHLSNNILSLLLQIQQGLEEDGLFLAVMCGQGTLKELRASMIQAESEIYGGVNPRIAPFSTLSDAGILLQKAGFILPVTDIENVIVRYNSAFDLMDDLRAMGMQNALIKRSRQPVSRRFFMRTDAIYKERFRDTDKRIRATFAFIWMAGWAPLRIKLDSDHTYKGKTQARLL